MKIGVLGGTFDPIHKGHLIIGEIARISAELDKVIFIPSGTHPFKNNKAITDSKERCQMVQLAIKSNPYFEISTFEMERTGVNYTIDTIRYLKEKYKETEIYFIIGSDILFEIEKWYKFKELIKLCKFIVFSRTDRAKEISKIIDKLETTYNINIKKVNSPVLPISSTEIRERVKDGKSIKSFVEESVEKYILENNIYGEDEYE